MGTGTSRVGRARELFAWAELGLEGGPGSATSSAGAPKHLPSPWDAFHLPNSSDSTLSRAQAVPPRVATLTGRGNVGSKAGQRESGRKVGEAVANGGSPCTAKGVVVVAFTGCVLCAPTAEPHPRQGPAPIAPLSYELVITPNLLLENPEHAIL